MFGDVLVVGQIIIILRVYVRYEEELLMYELKGKCSIHERGSQWDFRKEDIIKILIIRLSKQFH